MTCCPSHAQPVHAFDCERADNERKRADEAMQEACIEVLSCRSNLEFAVRNVVSDLASPDREVSPTEAANRLTNHIAALVVAMIRNPEAL